MSLYDSPSGAPPSGMGPILRGPHPPPQPPMQNAYVPPPPPRSQFGPHQGPPPRWGPHSMHPGGHWGRGPPPSHPMPHGGFGHASHPPGFSAIPRPPPAVHYNQMRMELVQELCSLRNQLNDCQAELKGFEVHQQEQTGESERNLAAHLAANQQERDGRIDELLQNERLIALQQQAKSVGLTVDAIEQALQQLIESCTKDNIARGKVWINQRISETSRSADVIGQYLLFRVAKVGADYTTRLHIVYLINDLIHNLKRKPCAPLQTALDSVVVPIFCLAYQAARTQDEEVTKQRRDKLEKVLLLWKSNQLFPSNLLERMGCGVIEQVNNENDEESIDIEKERKLAILMEEKINTTCALWRTEECTKHSESVHPITQHYQEQYGTTERQFKDFALHLQQEHARRLQYIVQLESRIKSEEERLAAMDAEEAAKIQQQQQPPPPRPPAPHPSQSGSINPSQPTSGSSLPDFTLPPPGFNPSLPPPAMLAETASKGGFSKTPSGASLNSSAGPTPLFPPGTGPPIESEGDEYYGGADIFQESLKNEYVEEEQKPLRTENENANEAEEGNLSQNDILPSAYQEDENETYETEMEGAIDQSSTAALLKEEPGTDESQPSGIEDPSIPRLPFWDLPAALMIPLVPLSRFDYHTLKPSKLRLPPPPLKKEEEHIKKAVEAFYFAPSHERPRDADGWEKLGLYEFHKCKEAALKRYNDKRRRSKDRHDKLRSHSVESSHNTEDEDSAKRENKESDEEDSDDDRDYRFRVNNESWEKWREEQRNIRLEALQRASQVWNNSANDHDDEGYGPSGHFEGGPPPMPCGNFDRRAMFHQGPGGASPGVMPPGPSLMRPRMGGPMNFRGNSNGNFPPSGVGMMGPGGPRPAPGGGQPPFMPMHPGGRGAMMRGPPPSLMGTPSGPMVPHPRMSPMMMRPPYGGPGEYHQYPYESGPGFYRGPPESGGGYGREGRREGGRGSRFSGGGRNSRSRSPSRSRSRSRSHSRDRQHHRSRSFDSRSRSSRRRTYSRSGSRSRSGYSSRSRSGSRSGSRSHSRSRSSRSRSRSRPRSEADRTPPRYTSAGSLLMSERRGYMGGGREHMDEGPSPLSGVPNYEQRALHLLERMGWNGRGLGPQEQGRPNPIDPYEEAGGPRSRMEQYRGVGMMPDPFSQFRQRKADGFITMLRDKPYLGGPPLDNYHHPGGRQSRFPHNRH